MNSEIKFSIPIPSMNDDYSLSQDLTTSLHYWWIIVVLMLAGTGVGWLLQGLLPAQYEARAEIAITVDLSRTGTLTGENQDILVNSAGKIINSFPVMAALEQEAREKYALTDAAQVKSMFALERMAESFALRVQHPDKQIALDLADTWSQLAMAALDNASRHALEVETLSRFLDSLSTCISQISAVGAENPYCSINSLEQLQVEVDKTNIALLKSRDGARGMTAGLSYSLNQPAQIMPQPVQNSKVQLLLGGAGIGLVLALWMIHNRWPYAWFRRTKSG